MKVHNLKVTGSLTSGGETLTNISASVSTVVGTLTSNIGSIESKTGSYATTGSNLLKGNQTISGSIIPSVTNTYDLGDPTHNFRHLYLSSASLYIDGTKVLGSTTQELQITTDTGQSFKILEGGSDTITLQSADGNITLATSGGGDVILDPTTGVIALKGTTTLYAGNKILSSDGNAVHFGNSVTMTGSLIVTGYIETQELRTTYISSSVLYRSGSTKFGDELTDTHSFTGSLSVSGSISVPGSGLVSGSSQISYTGLTNIPSGIVSGSSQISGFATTGSNTFISNQIVSGTLVTTGNMGVGIPSPTAKLHISGSAESPILDVDSNGFSGRYALLPGRFVVGTLSSGYPQIGYNFVMTGSVYSKIGNDTAWGIDFGNNNLMKFQYAPTGTGTFSWNTAMVVNNSGNIGMGTTAPNRPLEIVPQSAVPSLRLNNTAYNGNTGIELLTGAGNKSWLIAAQYNTGNAFEITPSTANGGTTFTTPVVTVLSSGNVGINVTNPTYGLTVGATANDAISWRNNGTEVGRLGIDGNTTNGWLALFNSGVSKVQISAGGVDNYFAGTGNFGIGTTTPSGKFHVDHGDTYHMGILHTYVSTYVTSTKFGRPSTDSNIELKYDIAGTEIAYIKRNYTSAQLRFDRGSTTDMIISGAGNVGINDSNPSTRLSINGANYIEMATFTTVDNSSIITNNSGYVPSFTSRYNSNSNVFTPTTNGVQILKAGMLYITVAQDIRTSSTTGYAYLHIRKNGTTISENLITNTNTEWDMINANVAVDVAANDIINFYYSAADILALDTGSWSQYVFLWSSR